MEQSSGAQPGSLKTHGAFRLASLVGDENIVYIEAFGSGQRVRGEFIGRVVILTDSRVVLGDIHSAESVTGSAESTVAASTWPRVSLARLKMLGPDDRWENEGQDGGLPSGCQIGLTYASGDELLLPIDPHSKGSRREAWEVLPSLSMDLTTPSVV